MTDTPSPALAQAQYGTHRVALEGAAADDHLVQIIRDSGEFYEAELLSSTRPLLEAGDIVLDVGANIGNHSTFWATVCGALVLAFEPDPGLFAILRRNIAANDLVERVFPRNFALGSERGRAALVAGPPGNAGATSVDTSAVGETTVLPVDDLPEIQDGVVRLVKVDVEGMELEVLRGAAATLDRDRPVLVVECADRRAMEQVREFLRPWGYALVDCFNATPTCVFVSTGWLYPSGYSAHDHVRETVGRLAWAQVDHENRLRVMNRRRT